MEGFIYLNLNLHDRYHLRIWPRTGRAFELRKDELNPTRCLPLLSHCTRRHPRWRVSQSFCRVIPSSSLLVWLCFHGIPMPKGSTKAALIEKVWQWQWNKGLTMSASASIVPLTANPIFLWSRWLTFQLRWDKTSEFRRSVAECSTESGKRLFHNLCRCSKTSEKSQRGTGLACLRDGRYNTATRHRSSRRRNNTFHLSHRLALGIWDAFFWRLSFRQFHGMTNRPKVAWTSAEVC